jgi:hypothetical protein
MLFVSLKLSKARAVLPNKKQLSEEIRARRMCSSKERLIKDERRVLSGPYTPEGKWSRNTPMHPEGVRPPMLHSWRGHKNLGGNWEPAFVPMVVLGTRTSRKLSQNPSKEFKDKLRPGINVVYPDRRSVRVHQRRAWALVYWRECFALTEQLSPKDRLAVLDDLTELLTEIFHGVRLQSAELFGLRRVLYVSKRLTRRDQNHSLRERSEALEEHPVVDRFPLGSQ